jgi:hypothetical protein
MTLDRILRVVEHRHRSHVGRAQARGLVIRAPLVLPAAPCDHLPRHGRKLRQGLVGLAAQHHIRPRLPERRHWSDRAMRPDRDHLRSLLQTGSPQTGNPLCRHAQLRLRTTPEQVRRRSRHHQKIFPERIQPLAHLLDRQIFHERIDQQNLVVRRAQHRLRGEQFQREVRLGAPEIRRSAKAPARIHQRVLHATS